MTKKSRHNFNRGARAFQDLVLLTLNSIDLDDLPAARIKAEVFKEISKLKVSDCYSCSNDGFDE